MVQLWTGSHQGKKNELASNCKLLEDRSNLGQSTGCYIQSTGCYIQIPTAHTFALPLYYTIFNTIFRHVASLTTMLFRDLDVSSPTPSFCVGWFPLAGLKLLLAAVLTGIPLGRPLRDMCDCTREDWSLLMPVGWCVVAGTFLVAFSIPYWHCRCLTQKNKFSIK